MFRAGQKVTPKRCRRKWYDAITGKTESSGPEAGKVYVVIRARTNRWSPNVGLEFAEWPGVRWDATEFDAAPETTA